MNLPSCVNDSPHELFEMMTISKLMSRQRRRRRKYSHVHLSPSLELLCQKLFGARENALNFSVFPWSEDKWEIKIEEGGDENWHQNSTWVDFLSPQNQNLYFQSGFIWIFTPKLQICWNINQLVTNKHHHPYCVGVRSKSFDSSICSLEIQLPTYKRSAGCISWMMPLTIEQLPLAFKLIRFVLKIPVKSPKLKVVKVNKHDWIDTDRLMSRYNQKLENPFKISNPWKWKKISRHFWYANKNVTKKSLA